MDGYGFAVLVWGIGAAVAFPFSLGMTRNCGEDWPSSISVALRMSLLWPFAVWAALVLLGVNAMYGDGVE